MNETTPMTDEEIRAVIGELPPQAAGRALAAHLKIDIQAAYDLLDGVYWRRAQEWLNERQERTIGDDQRRRDAITEDIERRTNRELMRAVIAAKLLELRRRVPRESAPT